MLLRLFAAYVGGTDGDTCALLSRALEWKQQAVKQQKRSYSCVGQARTLGPVACRRKKARPCLGLTRRELAWHCPHCHTLRDRCIRFEQARFDWHGRSMDDSRQDQPPYRRDPRLHIACRVIPDRSEAECNSAAICTSSAVALDPDRNDTKAASPVLPFQVSPHRLSHRPDWQRSQQSLLHN